MQLGRAGWTAALSRTASRLRAQTLQAHMATVTPSAATTPLAGYLQRIKECNVGLQEVSTFVPLIVEGAELGKLRPRFVDQLRQFPDVFIVSDSTSSKQVTLHSSLSTPELRTKAVAGVLDQLRAKGVITGWRNEQYPVTADFYSEPAFLVERAAAVHFGIKAYGVHVNGYVRGPDGSTSLWVGRRSRTKPTWPGKLDHIVAGGQPHGLSPLDNVIKECQEEAGISEELAQRARPVGAVSYTTVSEVGYKPDVLFVFDIELPPDFKPAPQDGEVEEFYLMPIDKVAHIVQTTTEFKTNCNLVIIDFLVRHGFITPDQPGYLELVSGLRSGVCR